MQIVSSLSPLALEHEGGTAVAMGYFDGIHIGHRAVIEGAVEWAKAHGAAPAVFTFKLPMRISMPLSQAWVWSITSAPSLRRSAP